MENNEYLYEQEASVSEVKSKKRGRGFVKFIALALVLAIIAGAAGFGGAALYGSLDPAGSTPAGESDRDAAPEKPTAPALSTGTPLNAESGGFLSPEELYEAVLPSCVGLTVSTTVNIWGQTTTSAASGSGFILTADGYIATNYHVIESAAENSAVEITVTLSNGEKYAAKLVGGEEENDVAIVKIDAQGLTPVRLGDSSALRVAQWVCTVGNPLGELTFSFSDGRVSALDRAISTDNSARMNMLQMSCPINPGNSGGPLFDEQGRVVGIVTAKYTKASSGVSAEGLGFAIPIDDVKAMLADIIKFGYVTGKPLLGITGGSVTAAMQRYGLPAGAAVESVTEGASADRAGIQSGDIITAMDGTAVDSWETLAAILSTHRAGDTVTLTVYRMGQTLKLEATLDEKTAKSRQIPEAEAPANVPNRPFGGGYGYNH